MTVVIAVLAGALIGLSLGALGGGGSILAVPVLVYLLEPFPLLSEHRFESENCHVSSRHLQDLRQDHLDRLRPARRPGQGNNPH